MSAFTRATKGAIYKLMSPSELRTFAPVAIAHPYSARKFTCYVMHRAHALSTEMNNDREDGHYNTIQTLLTLPKEGFSVTII